MYEVTLLIHDKFIFHSKFAKSVKMVMVFLPACLQMTQVLASGEALPGLTRSIINPLGRLGMDGNVVNTPLLFEQPFSVASFLFRFNGGETLSCFFLTDCLVLGGDTGVSSNVLRLRF